MRPTAPDPSPRDAKMARVSRGKTPGGVWVCWRWRRGSDTSLRLEIADGGLVTWRLEGERLDDRRAGAEVVWQHGHLVSVGPDGDRLFRCLSDLELQPQEVDAELKRTTNYEEPPE